MDVTSKIKSLIEIQKQRNLLLEEQKEILGDITFSEDVILDDAVDVFDKYIIANIIEEKVNKIIGDM